MVVITILLATDTKVKLKHITCYLDFSQKKVVLITMITELLITMESLNLATYIFT